MDLSDWLTEPEAADKLQCSVKTIKRYAAAGKIEVRKRIRPGLKPENVCAPRDIERLMPTAYAVPPDEPEPEPEAEAGNQVAPATLLRSMIAAMDAIAKAVIERPQIEAPQASNRKPKPEVPIQAKVWLNLNEAVAFSGLPRRELRNYLRDGTFEAKQFGRRWRVLRSSIERGSLR